MVLSVGLTHLLLDSLLEFGRPTGVALWSMALFGTRIDVIRLEWRSGWIVLLVVNIWLYLLQKLVLLFNRRLASNLAMQDLGMLQNLTTCAH